MHNNKKKKIVVAVSGGFDPLHIGHVRLFKAARALGDILVVIINNDNWLRRKKGQVFMPEQERREIIEALACVDKVVLTKHAPETTDVSVCDTLREVKPDIFANGGDRKRDNIPEVAVCREIGCRMAFNVGKGGKVQSSSWLLDKIRKKERPDLSQKKRKRV